MERQDVPKKVCSGNRIPISMDHGFGAPSPTRRSEKYHNKLPTKKGLANSFSSGVEGQSCREERCSRSPGIVVFQPNCSGEMFIPKEMGGADGETSQNPTRSNVQKEGSGQQGIIFGSQKESNNMREDLVEGKNKKSQEGYAE